MIKMIQKLHVDCRLPRFHADIVCVYSTVAMVSLICVIKQ